MRVPGYVTVGPARTSEETRRPDPSVDDAINAPVDASTLVLIRASTSARTTVPSGSRSVTLPDAIHTATPPAAAKTVLRDESGPGPCVRVQRTWPVARSVATTLRPPGVGRPVTTVPGSTANEVTRGADRVARTRPSSTSTRTRLLRSLGTSAGGSIPYST